MIMGRSGCIPCLIAPLGRGQRCFLFHRQYPLFGQSCQTKELAGKSNHNLYSIIIDALRPVAGIPVKIPVSTDRGERMYRSLCWQAMGW